MRGYLVSYADSGLCTINWNEKLDGILSRLTLFGTPELHITPLSYFIECMCTGDEMSFVYKGQKFSMNVGGIAQGVTLHTPDEQRRSIRDLSRPLTAYLEEYLNK
jgi:hypothetical protein